MPKHAMGAMCLLALAWTMPGHSVAQMQNNCYITATEDVFVVVYSTDEDGVKGAITQKRWVKVGERVYVNLPHDTIHYAYATGAYDTEVNLMANLRQVKGQCSDSKEISIP
jgi:hypothetical protein